MQYPMYNGAVTMERILGKSFISDLYYSSVGGTQYFIAAPAQKILGTDVQLVLSTHHVYAGVLL